MRPSRLKRSPSLQVIVDDITGITVEPINGWAEAGGFGVVSQTHYAAWKPLLHEPLPATLFGSGTLSGVAHVRSHSQRNRPLSGSGVEIWRLWPARLQPPSLFSFFRRRGWLSISFYVPAMVEGKFALITAPDTFLVQCPKAGFQHHVREAFIAKVQC